MLNDGSFLKVFGDMLINAFELNPVEFYLNVSTDENDAISHNAIKLLGELHDARAFDPLVQIFNSESDINKQYAAINALAEMNDPRTINLFIEELNNKSGFRSVAAQALGKSCDPKGFDPLILALGDPSYGVVVNIVQSLSNYGDKRAVEPLIRSFQMITTNKPWKTWERNIVINKFIEAFGNLKDPTAIDYIIPFIKKRKFRENTQKALTQIIGIDYGEKYSDWINWWDMHKSEYLHE